VREAVCQRARGGRHHVEGLVEAAHLERLGLRLVPQAHLGFGRITVSEVPNIFVNLA
jgi:hypothetical protein